MNSNNLNLLQIHLAIFVMNMGVIKFDVGFLVRIRLYLIGR